jgi:hypothetical protein
MEEINQIAEMIAIGISALTIISNLIRAYLQAKRDKLDAALDYVIEFHNDKLIKKVKK